MQEPSTFDQYPDSVLPPRQPAPPISSLVFQTSEKTDKLVAALAVAQGEIDVALKDAENPHFRSSYADLASVWRACRVPLSKAGVAVMQWPIPATKPNYVALITRVAHADQWIQSGLEMQLAKPDAHGVGTALTYLRRYMLSSVAGVAPDDEDLKDDDGNAASGKKTQARGAQPNQRQANAADNSGASKPGPGPTPPTQGPAPHDAQKPAINVALSQAQIKRLFAIAEKAKWTTDQIKIYMVARWEIQSTKDLTREYYDALVAQIERGTFAQARAMLISQGVAGPGMPEG